MPSPISCSSLASINARHTSARVVPYKPVGTKSSSIISIALFGSLIVNPVVSAIVTHWVENAIALPLHSSTLAAQKRIDSGFSGAKTESGRPLRAARELAEKRAEVEGFEPSRVLGALIRPSSGSPSQS
jgi:hypothetical protein